MVEINFNAVIEVLGKPQEHVENMLDSIFKKLQGDERFTLKETKKHGALQQEGTELFATFIEVDLETTDHQNMIDFCFDYMPSSIEVIKPMDIALTAPELSHFLNDLQAKLHQVDMLAKKMKLERDVMAKNMGGLLKNYLLVLLNNNKLTLEQLTGYTGVEKDKLADYLDRLIDQGKVDLDGEVYSRIKTEK